jgi:F-type H+-transporting ATPase subunit a
MIQSIFSTMREPRPPKAVRLVALLCAIFALLVLPTHANDKESTGAAPVAAHSESAESHAEHHGLPNDAPVLFHVGPLPVNNSMVITWIVAIGVIVFAQKATKRIRSTAEAANEVPSGAQNFWEFLVEGLYNFLGEILGPKLIKKTFWFFATIFIFILFTNWFGLIPGVGTIGWGHYDAEGLFHLQRPMFRGGNADLNMTAAMALTFFAFWIIWAIGENAHGKTGPAGAASGVWGVIKHLFAPKGKEKGFMGMFLIVVFLAVGLIEVVSILFRPVSLSFRLYGNIFAGENILEAMQNIVPGLAPFLPIPFYFLELLVGLVQALVFTLLTSVFTLLICEHEEEHGEEAKAHH